MKSDKAIKALRDDIHGALPDKEGYHLETLILSTELDLPAERTRAGTCPRLSSDEIKNHYRRRSFWRLSRVPTGIAAAVLFVMLAVPAFILYRSGVITSYPVRVLSLEGEVSLGDNGISVKNRGSVSLPAVFHAGPNGRIDLEVKNDLRIRMLPESRMRLYRDNSDSGKIVINAEHGRVLILSDSKDVIEVLTPTSLVLADVSFFGINVKRNLSTRIEVYNGDIRVNRRPWINSNYLTSRIEERLKNEALVIRSDEACHIAPPYATGYSSSSPVPVRGEDFHMMEKAVSFLKKSSEDFSLAASLVPVECKLVPGLATIFVDGAPRRTGGEEACAPMILKKGTHRVVVRADGYLPGEIDLDTKDSKTIKVTLERDNREGYPAWAKTLQSEYIFRGENGIIISVSKNGRVSASNGRKIIWDLEMGAPLVQAPLYRKGRLVFATRDGIIRLLGTESGDVIWEAPFGEIHGIHLDKGGDVFLTAGNHIICREGSSGMIRWSQNFDSGLTGAISSDPAMVYVSLESGEILGLDPASGRRIRGITIDGPATLLAMGEERVFAGTETGLVVALERGLEEIQWKRIVSSFPAFDMLPDSGGVIVLSGEGKVERISSKGELHWSHNLGHACNGGLAMDSSRVYVTGPETLVVIGKDQGKVYWSLVIPGVLSRSVALGPGRVFFVTAPRGLVALRL